MNMKVVPVDGVTVLRNSCFYKGETFSTSVYKKNPCEKWTCYADTNVVVVTKCGDPPHGCSRKPGLQQQLPFCCNTTCRMKSYMCLTPDGRLMRDGEQKNLRNPCVKYICKKGILITQTCPTYEDSKCKASLVDECAPYPACCGVTKVCETG
uniref:Putative kDa family member n=1 Tax=Rhipicephalus microplus TaxID=6941 RepID=A0A6G5AGI0_RHIMP